MIKNKRFLAIWTAMLALVLGLSLFAAAGLAQDKDEPVVESPPLSETEAAAPTVALTLSKSSSVLQVSLGRSLIYTLVISNPGELLETVTVVRDTLPPGFEFVAMEPGSDVATPPGETSGSLTWTDPIVIPAGESRRVIYRVRAGASGVKENSAEIETLGGAQIGPVTATVTVMPSRAFLPLAIRTKLPETTLPFVDTFDNGWPANWAAFTNYPGMQASDWVWYPWNPTTGFISYEPESWKGFSLLMYLGPGHTGWADYRVVTSLRPTGDRLAGLWLRGEYVQQTDGLGGWVGGYYLHLRPDDETVYLWRIQSQAHQFHVADIVQSAVYSLGIQRGKWYHLKAEVRGANIKAWLKLKSDPESAYRQVINWTDPYNTYPKGTVGLSVFRTTALYDDIAVTSLAALGQ